MAPKDSSKPRNANGTDAACGAISASTTRGYTNQEETPTQYLVNLNARLYDATIGKFMAADSIVPNAYDSQSYNRYAYVTNNPLSLVDPSAPQPPILDPDEMVARFEGQWRRRRWRKCS